MSREYVLQPFRPPAELRIDYHQELNPQQLAAVTAPPGPALVLAGAGAGKTRTLTYRVAWLIEHGISADHIVLLTFTNKAAREMMHRVVDLLGGDLSTLWGGTFHSIGMRVLRRHADRLGYRPDFTIADREDGTELIATCIAAAGIDVTASRFPNAEVLGELFSRAANQQRSVRQAVELDHPHFSTVVDQIEAVAGKYAERKRTAALMDFDDLLVLWLRLLREHPDIRELYQRRFQFILVDEYQDTNKLQADLIDTLAAQHGNVMAVGDDSQSIYSWRGANFANILEFPKRHPGAMVYKIETNYRSTPEILALANSAIAANTRQFPKQLQAARRSGTKPVQVTCGEAGEQAAFVGQRVLELRDEGVGLQHMAVLYRSHFHALELQLELTRRNIPFSITSGIRFFEQAHLKDVTAYLKLITNPMDELAFKRLVRMLPGIGGKGAEKLWLAFAAGAVREAAKVPPPGSVRGAGSSDLDGTLDPVADPAPGFLLAPLLSKLAERVPKKTAAAWAAFTITISQCEAPEVRSSPSAMLRTILEADYIEYLENSYANPRSRLDDLEQLAAYAQQFASTVEFLTQLALLTNVEADTSSPRQEDEERLRLSTVHQAKGLEFDVVFVIMLCDGLFPSSRSLESSDGEEEERRLFYVAVTRAKNELYLSYPLLRFSARGGEALQQPSRFLGELPRDVREEWNLRPAWEYGSRAVYGATTGSGPSAGEGPKDEPF